MKLTVEQLPENIQNYYTNSTIHKIMKRGSSTIVIQTRNHQTHVWKKKSVSWVLSQKKKPEKFGVRLNIPT